MENILLIIKIEEDCKQMAPLMKLLELMNHASWIIATHANQHIFFVMNVKKDTSLTHF
jgi:hypothetical protein